MVMFLRVGPLGLTLILLALSCGRPFHHEMSIGPGVAMLVDAPQGRVRYPEPARMRVTLRNGGNEPFTLTWPPPFRLRPGCARELQRDPVEAWFQGETLDRGFTGTPYLWRWKASLPARLTVAPGESRVLADVTFQPPKGAHSLTGTFCIRAYGYELPGGVVYRGPGR